MVVHPDLAEALAAAEDALSIALGRDVKARVRGTRCVVELEFEQPSEAIELANSILRCRLGARLSGAGVRNMAATRVSPDPPLGWADPLLLQFFEPRLRRAATRERLAGSSSERRLPRPLSWPARAG